MSTATTMTTDVLVVGAGPAGCAAAIELARAGRSVLLIDQYDFPRDKICGDGLIPDAMAAFEHLGVISAVEQQAIGLRGLTCHGPRGGQLHIPAKLAVLPRYQLDQILFERAQAVGVTTMTGARFLGPIRNEDGRINGAHVKTNAGSTQIDANWTILATGANVTALKASGQSTRTLPSAMALRAYVKHPNFLDDNGQRVDQLHISWHKAYAPGYAWIFPCPNGVYNIGVGLYGLHQQRTHHRQRMSGALSQLFGLKPNRPNLSNLFERFIDTSPMAKRLMATGERLGEVKGAPLRCSLEGAHSGAPGLLVTGEAMGSTYALTGEGIGKAMETGILSAESLCEHSTDVDICQSYAKKLSDLTPKFSVYEKANRINRLPWLIDLAIARGNQSPSLVKRMSLVLEEKANPARLFSLRGAWKFLTE